MFCLLAGNCISNVLFKGVILNVTIRFVMILLSLSPSEQNLLIICFYMNVRGEDSAPLS